jgi:hypothetical protein
MSDPGNLLPASVYKHVLVETGSYVIRPYNPVPQVLGGSPIYSFLLVELSQLL